MAKFSIATDLLATIRNWSILLRNLTFADNFKGYEWEGSIVAGETVKITHPLKVIPTRFIVTDCEELSSPVSRPGIPKATVDFFYLTCSSNFRGKILILP